MFKIPHVRLLILLILITKTVFAQEEAPFKYKNECFKLLIEANSSIRTEKDTVNYSRLFNQIDSLIKLENHDGFYVKYLALNGVLLSGHGYLEEGLKYNIYAVEYGEKHLPPNSPRIAVSHANLGYTYLKLGKVDSFINHSLISNEILLRNPVKNAGNLIQTNFNLQLYLGDNPDLFLKLTEQNDSLVDYLPEEDYDIKAMYHLRKSKRAISDNNLRVSKLHINKAIQYFNADENPKINLRKYFYGAVATHFYLLKNYEKAIENYKVLNSLFKVVLTYNNNAYTNNQISKCYLGLNMPDSAMHYAYKAYENLKVNSVEKQKYFVPVQALEVLKLNKLITGEYDMEVYEVLHSLSEELHIVPIHYLEYARIRSSIHTEDKEFYKTVLLQNIENATHPVFKSYYTSKLAKHYFDLDRINVADSLFDQALYFNQVLPEKTNSLVYNSNMMKSFVDYKYKILQKNKVNYTDAEILERFDVMIKNLLTYIYENWDGEDKDEVLKQIQFYSDEAIEFCYSKSKLNGEVNIPYVEYALYFSDQSNSILFKYNQRRSLAFENANFSKEKNSKLQYYKGKLDAYFYGKVGEINEKEIIEIQANYNDLLLEAQTSQSAFVETERFDEFIKHLHETKGKYDEVLVFHSSDTHVFKVDIKSRQIVKLDVFKADIIQNQQTLFDAMVNQNVKEYEESANKLYQLFFPEAIKESSRNILVINAPDLLPIPFEALVKSITNQPFNKLDYLLSNHTFTYNQGLSSDFDFEKNFDLSLPYVGVYSKNGNNLHYAKSEIEGVSKLLKGEIYDVDKFKQSKILERLKLAQVIHIASHSEIDSANAYSSQLVFGDSAQVNLKYYEIMNMDINPNLLVLNACSTGDGEYKIGEGKISMARAFNYAGAQNVLVNTWDVSDFSVKKIMESFFGFYTDKKEAAKALQLAKLEYLKTSDDLTGNPLYWAGTIFVSSSHVSTRQYLWNLGLAVLILSGVLIGFSVVKRK